MHRSTLALALVTPLLLFALACDEPVPSAADPGAEPPAPVPPTQVENRYDPHNYAFPRPTTGPDGQPYDGPFFDVPEDWPATAPAAPDGPWNNYQEITAENVNDFMVDLRNWVLGIMLPVDWRVQQQSPDQRWYSGPWMPRETVRGMYDGNNQPAGSYGPEQTDCAVNYTVDLYGHPGGYTFGQVWGDLSRTVFDPNISATSTQFPQGAVVVKLAMTSLPIEQVPSLRKAPSWWIYRDSVVGPADCSSSTNGPLEWIEVRVVQMDVIVKDERLAPETGWVFGTLAYNQGADPRGWDGNPETEAWYQSSAVGAMWGNDPGVTPGNPLEQSMIYPQISEVNAKLLGYGGRVSGPIDGGQPQPGATPGSACMSCHGTAQVPVNFALLVPPTGLTEQELMKWFQNRPGDVPFTAGDIATDYDFIIAAGAANAEQGAQGKSFSEMESIVGKHH